MNITILKIGGNLLDDPPRLAKLLDDFSKIEGNKALVHGGGKAASSLAEKLGLEAKMHKGRRITDAPMMEVVTWVYSGLNKQLVALLQARACDALGLCGADLDVMRAHKRVGWEVDYGFAGDIDVVKGEQVYDLLAAGKVPVFAPLTHDGQGQLLNTNADTIAAKVAESLAPFGAVTLVYCFELPGLMRDPSDPHSLIAHLDVSSFGRYKAEGIITGGMIPKLDNAFTALRAGAGQVLICGPGGIPLLHAPGFPGTTIQLNHG